MDDRRIRRTSAIRIDTGMLSGSNPSSCADNLIPSMVQSLIRSIVGYKLRFIDVTVSGVWDKEDDKENKEKK